MRWLYKILPFFIGLAVFFYSLSCTSLWKPYDLVIKNGFIIDGTGNPWFKSDIGIKKKKIVKIGFIDKTKQRKALMLKI